MYNVIRSFLISLLTWEARFALLLHKPKIIAVTGNLGKTTTKDAIFATVSPYVRTRKSEKSFNSDIGVPLAILGLQNPWSNPALWLWTLIQGAVAALAPGFPKLLVLEVGADKPGDIAAIASWLSPDIAVYTGVPEIPVHVAYFSSRDEIVREKRVLLKNIRPGGVAIINGDMNPTEAMSGMSVRIVTYGFSPECDFAVSGMNIVSENGLPVGISARARHAGEEAQLSIRGAIGKPRAYAALAALAAANALGIGMKDAVAALAGWNPPPGRMRILRGLSGSIIIDDSYNSSPAAALSALETLAEVSGKRRIAVLGDMRELGAMSERGHAMVGERAAHVADLLITVGEESKVLAQAARAAGMPADAIREYGYDSSQQVGADLSKELREGDVVLIKGSQNHIRLERAVYQLLADRSKAGDELVRHERAWRKKA